VPLGIWSVSLSPQASLSFDCIGTPSPCLSPSYGLPVAATSADGAPFVLLAISDTAVPEPFAAGLVAFGLAALALLRGTSARIARDEDC
jgi:hypothetical protein